MVGRKDTQASVYRRTAILYLREVTVNKGNKCFWEQLRGWVLRTLFVDQRKPLHNTALVVMRSQPRQPATATATAAALRPTGFVSRVCLGDREAIQ